MNKTRLSIATAGLAALLITACSDNIVEAGDSAVETQATLKVLVVDAITNKPLEKVEVKNAGGSSKKTDKNGAASLGKVRVGCHNITFKEVEGYANAVYTVCTGAAEQGGSDATNEGIFIADESAKIIRLYPLGASLEGYLWFTDKDDQTKPANGAKVSISFGFGSSSSGSSSSGSSEETTITYQVASAEVVGGKYVFEKLPIGVDAIVRFSGYEVEGSDIVYAGGNLSAGKLEAGKNLANSHTYSQSVPAFKVISVTKDVKKGGDIEITFSDKVDVNKNRSVSLSNQDNVVYDEIWDGNKVTLKLFGNNEWNYYEGNITVNATSINGEVLSSSASIQINVTDLKGKKVENIAAKTISSSSSWSDVSFASVGNIQITFDFVEGYYKYQVCAKAEKNGYNKVVCNDSDIMASATAPAGGKETVTFNRVSDLGATDTKPFADGGTIVVYVIAKAQGGRDMVLDGLTGTAVTASAP
ncbi:MAG: hypothetical protein LBH25_06040 [Fibromonadaceae bacterium]|jgi:hypothetical protein|nr:hypothetical protein [Fibromonadaceae bacterium]